MTTTVAIVDGHTTTVEDGQGYNPASAACSCGWAYTGGGYYSCDREAQRHRLDAYEALPYAVKCDECRDTIGRTDSVRRSAEGGMCAPCRMAVLKSHAVEIQHGGHSIRYFQSGVDSLGRRTFIDYNPCERRGQVFHARPEDHPLV